MKQESKFHKTADNTEEQLAEKLRDASVKLQESFQQKFAEDGTAILPVSWDDKDDDVWESYL